MREDTRFRLLHVLDRNPEVSQRALAKDVGVSLGSVNARLNALIEIGLVKIGNSQTGTSRFGFAYRLTGSGKAEKMRLAARYLGRRRAQMAALLGEIEALEAEFAPQSDRPA